MRLPTSLRLVPLILLLAACGSSAPRPKSTPGSPAPPAAVERFMELVSARDYLEMGYVFGTQEGPILRRDPAPDVERRMYALASVLAHDEYTILDQSPVPGRVGNAIRFDVRLLQRGKEYDVPFTTVRGPDARWFVEQIGLEAVTGTVGEQ